jgi:AcrR family transcriptional regulator
MPRPKHDPAATALSRERIVEAALLRLDRDGLAAFSLREVARDLGVYPTALYWHVGGGRDALLAAAAGAALADVAPPAAVGDWRDWFRELFRRYRAAMRRHPGVAPLLGGQLLSNAGIDLDLVEGMLAALARAGFEGAALVEAYNAAVAAMLGFATLELAEPPAEGSAALQDGLLRRLETVDPARHPVLSAHLPRMVNRAFILRWEDGRAAPLEAGFATFVEAFVAGLDALPRRAVPPGSPRPGVPGRRPAARGRKPRHPAAP